MRKMILYCLLGIAVILTIFSCISVHSRSAREDEAEQGLSEAIDATISAIFVNTTYNVASQEEFVADFIQGLLLNLESTSKVTVNVLAADEEKGILSVEVIETYQHINGKTGTVSECRTMIFDKVDEEDAEICTIYLYLSESDMQQEDGTYEDCYKIYSAAAGEIVSIPGAHAEGSRTFKGWCTLDGKMLQDTFKIEHSVSAYAVFDQ